MENRKKTRFWAFLLLNGLLLMSITAIGYLAWDKLPQRVPVHFGADGTPNRWAEKGWEVILLFIMPWLLTGLMYGFTALIPWLRRHPQWVNIPNKEKFLSLPPEKQAPIFDYIIEVLTSLAAAINFLFLCLCYGVVQVAIGVYSSLPWWAVGPGLGLVFCIVIINIVRVYGIIDRMNL